MSLAIRSRVVRALLALPLLSLPASVHASGFALDSPSARAMGLAGAYVAQTGDPSSIAFNPASIAFLKGKHFYASGLLGSLSTDVVGLGPYPPMNALDSVSQGLGPLPTVYYAQQLGEKVALGIGLDQPFAFKNVWQDPTAVTAEQRAEPLRSNARFICLECEIRSWRVNPTVAVKLADRLAVGGGVDLRFSQFSLTRRLVADTTSLPAMTDVAELQLDTSTTPAVGWNVGLLASPSETVSIGLSYRHKVVVTHDAQATFVQVPTGTAAVDDAVAARLPTAQAAEVGFVYPASVAAGIAWHGDRLTIEGDLTRTLWSTFDSVVLRFRTTAYDSVLPEDFSSAWTAALGFEYALREDWDVRGGYSFDTSPQPDTTLSPFFSDSSRHGFSIGGSYKREGLRLDAAVRLAIRGSRTTDGKNRYGYEGTYDPGTSLVAGVSVGYRF